MALGPNYNIVFPFGTYASVGANNTFTGSNTFTQDATFNARILMPNNASLATGITLGPSTSAGVTIWRNGSGTVQFALADASANANLAASQFSSTNDQGIGIPNFRAAYKTNYGMYINNAGPYVALVSNGTVALKADASQNITCAAQVVVGSASANPSGLAAGALFFNTTSGKLQVYTGSAWQTVTSA